jgi:uncharacterized NAD(P)/FAD-binding protein YdhS
MIVATEQEVQCPELTYAVNQRSARVRAMIPPFEIFQSESDGNVLWRGTAASMDDAKSRIRELAAEAPGDFIIMSRRTGHKLVLNFDGNGSERSAGGGSSAA